MNKMRNLEGRGDELVCTKWSVHGYELRKRNRLIRVFLRDGIYTIQSAIKIEDTINNNFGVLETCASTKLRFGFVATTFKISAEAFEFICMINPNWKEQARRKKEGAV